jgi:hypothetical protein
MPEIINIYCDESCHLEHDPYKVLVIGSIWCPEKLVPTINADIRQIKINHDLPRNFETKWVKVSPAKKQYYLDLVNYFFDNPNLHVRAIVVPDKSILEHEKYQQTHDDFYYKMYFDMLKLIISPEDRFKIYLDIKDTRGGIKIKKLHEVICSSIYDFQHEIIEKIQIVRSREIEILQLCDLLIGAISAANRGITISTAKNEIIDLIRKRSGYTLNRNTLYRESKFNLLIWRPKEVD